jgi:putative phosphoribosyl transferase
MMKFDCELRTLERPGGVVVLAHGSGVTRHDARALCVAEELERGGFASVLVDLLDAKECREPHNVFDVELQASRLLELTRWLDAERGMQALALGYFGTGVGTGVALRAAAMAPERVRAIVSAGGRPDTALYWLARVRAPTLFISDEEGASPPWYIDAAFQRLDAEKALVAVPSAGHAFEEPGAIQAVAGHARRWFARHLAGARQPA